MSGLSFKHISKPLADGAAFEDFNLEIDDGEFVALVGDKGCGKAELVRMAQGYGGAFSGEVFVGDKLVSRFSKGQEAACLINDIPLMGTPRQEIRKLLRIRNVSRPEADARINRAAERTGVAEALDVRYARLSPEMRLRAGMTRAIALESKAALFIDPFEDMDTRTTARMRVAVMDFFDLSGMAFVLSTHTGNAALSMATRVVAMREGKILQSDTPQNIYDFPADRYVAEYFGSSLINIFPVTLEQAGETVYAAFGENHIPVPAGKLGKLVDPGYVGRRVLMGVRPENVHYEQAFLSVSPESALDVTVRHIEIMGSETYLHTTLSGVEGDFIARVDPRCITGKGAGMTLAIDCNRLHFFDLETEKTILSRL